MSANTTILGVFTTETTPTGQSRLVPVPNKPFTSRDGKQYMFTRAGNILRFDKPQSRRARRHEAREWRRQQNMATNGN